MDVSRLWKGRKKEEEKGGGKKPGFVYSGLCP
jgi:hypothetical protein